MKSVPTVTRLLSRLAATALTIGLVGAAGLASAGVAQVAVTGFTATSGDGFVFAVDQYQAWDLRASNGGGAAVTQLAGGQASWSPGTRLAQTSQALARANTETFTDNFTGLTTVGFTAIADAKAPAYASSSVLTGGAFTLVDADGAFVGGSITFDVYFDLSVDLSADSAPLLGQALLSLLASSDGGGAASFADGISNELVGSTETKSGHYTWTMLIDAGEAAYYTLAGAASVPEPSGIALALLSLVGLGATRRRRSTSALAA